MLRSTVRSTGAITMTIYQHSFVLGVQDFLAKHYIMWVGQPSYSPNLALSEAEIPADREEISDSGRDSGELLQQLMGIHKENFTDCFD